VLSNELCLAKVRCCARSYLSWWRLTSVRCGQTIWKLVCPDSAFWGLPYLRQTYKIEGHPSSLAIENPYIDFPLEDMSPALEYYTRSNFSSQDEKCQQFVELHARNPISATKRDVYYNPRLDPKRFLDGPLSENPATRLRQMLARPGIVARIKPSQFRAFPTYQIHQIAPGICDGISARCALEAGFSCLYQRQDFGSPRIIEDLMNDTEFSVAQRRLPRD